MSQSANEISQDQRFLAALDPTACPIDPRRMNHLVDLAHEYARFLNYYNNNNVKDGNWQVFFPRWEELLTTIDAASPVSETMTALLNTAKTSQPHFALFLTFLQLLREARGELNQITQRHLEFYYRQNLEFTRQNAIPDQLYVTFELTEDVASCLLPQGTQLSAGADASGVERIYQTDAELVVYPTQIAQAQALHIDANGYFRSSTLDPAEQSAPWSPFATAETLPLAQPVGFAWASPDLSLSAGTRTITLDMTFLRNVFIVNLENALVVELSTEEDWLMIDPSQITLEASTNVLTLTLNLTADQPAIVGYDAAQLDGNLATTDPVLRCTLDPAQARAAYEGFATNPLQSIKLTIAVTGVSEVQLSNDFGALDGSKAFQPFGPIPQIGASLYLDQSEITAKAAALTDLTLNLEWQGVPVLPELAQATKKTKKKSAKALDALDNFGSHYAVYDEVLGTTTTNASFQAQMDLCGETQSETSDLFDISDASTAHIIEFTGLDLTPIANQPLVRLRLAAPNEETFQAFGDNQYNRVYTEQLLKKQSDAPVSNGEIIELPNAPYLPTLASLSLNYTCEITDAPGQLLHLHPYGYAQPQNATPLLFPNYVFGSAYCYLGFAALIPPQQITLFWQTVTGGALVDAQQTLDWHYLRANQWQPLEVNDGTDGLQVSGMVDFALPEMTADQMTPTLMSAEYQWLRIALQANVVDPTSVSQVQHLTTQVVSATFVDQENDPTHYAEPLPAGSITGLVDAEPDIAAVNQPDLSFGGRAAEDDATFYVRVSQRLRHKNRALSAWDHANLVLQNFPELYKVKTLASTAVNDANFTSMPGATTLAVVPRLYVDDHSQPLQPRVSQQLLSRIGDYIRPLCSSWAEVFISNPRYVPIQIVCDVTFVAGYDPGYYQQQLDQELRYFLAPWTRAGQSQTIMFGGSVYRSEVIDFIKNIEYIATIDALEMICDGAFVEQAVAGTAGDILTSNEEHRINEPWDRVVKAEEEPATETIPLTATQMQIRLAGGQGGDSELYNGGAGYVYDLLLTLGDLLIGAEITLCAGVAGGSNKNCGDGAGASYIRLGSGGAARAALDDGAYLIVAGGGGGAGSAADGQAARAAVDGGDGQFYGDSGDGVEAGGAGGAGGAAGEDGLAKGGEGSVDDVGEDQIIPGGLAEGVAGGGGGGFSGGGGGGRQGLTTGGYGGGGGSCIANAITSQTSVVAESAVQIGDGVVKVRYL